MPKFRYDLDIVDYYNNAPHLGPAEIKHIRSTGLKKKNTIFRQYPGPLGPDDFQVLVSGDRYNKTFVVPPLSYFTLHMSDPDDNGEREFTATPGIRPDTNQVIPYFINNVETSRSCRIYEDQVVSFRFVPPRSSTQVRILDFTIEREESYTRPS